jgi:hypothetical protein
MFFGPSDANFPVLPSIRHKSTDATIGTIKQLLFPFVANRGSRIVVIQIHRALT